MYKLYYIKTSNNEFNDYIKDNLCIVRMTGDNHMKIFFLDDCLNLQSITTSTIFSVTDTTDGKLVATRNNWYKITNSNLAVSDDNFIEEMVALRLRVTKSAAKAFYRDLCGTVYGDPTKTCGGVMSVKSIAIVMRISTAIAKRYCNAMLYYGITERQGGMLVV